MSEVSLEAVTEAMFAMVKEYHGKRNLKALDLQKAMRESADVSMTIGVLEPVVGEVVLYSWLVLWGTNKDALGWLGIVSSWWTIFHEHIHGLPDLTGSTCHG